MSPSSIIRMRIPRLPYSRSGQSRLSLAGAQNLFGDPPGLRLEVVCSSRYRVAATKTTINSKAIIVVSIHPRVIYEARSGSAPHGAHESVCGPTRTSDRLEGRTAGRRWTEPWGRKRETNIKTHRSIFFSQPTSFVDARRKTGVAAGSIAPPRKNSYGK